MQRMLWFLAALVGFLATHPATAAVLRKKSGRAIIMGLSRVELENTGVGQYILIENFEKNQWTGLIKKIYRVNRARIMLIDDDSEEMEVGETFRIKPGEAPRSENRPVFDPMEIPPQDDDGEDLAPVPEARPVPPPAPSLVERTVQEPSEHDRLLLTATVVTRYYIVPAGKQEGDLHGTGTQVQGTYQLQKGLGFHLGIRNEDVVYTGVDQFSDYDVSVLMYFAGVSYSWNFPRWSLSSGLRYLIQGKGDGSLQDTLVDENQRPVNLLVRGVGQLQETDFVLSASYNWEYVSLFVEGTISLQARYSTKYRWQYSAEGPNGEEILQELRTESTFPVQVEGFGIGISLSL
ncbi:hypothetical protein [Oligoflexus tunisiensis]|uniref:hypothetical protein n=1 Tax=Oligoflexus tunisiensis TaxID=708132 RepID=UPI00114CC3A3|nr:hypothetical protein [Oligoflexus tunisiensis]